MRNFIAMQITHSEKSEDGKFIERAHGWCWEWKINAVNWKKNLNLMNTFAVEFFQAAHTFPSIQFSLAVAHIKPIPILWVIALPNEANLLPQIYFPSSPYTPFDTMYNLYGEKKNLIQD